MAKKQQEAGVAAYLAKYVHKAAEAMRSCFAVPVQSYAMPALVERDFQGGCYWVTAGEPRLELTACCIVDDFGNLVRGRRL